MAPVKIGARESTVMRTTERSIGVFKDISETVYLRSGFNPCGDVCAWTFAATPRYHEIYLDIRKLDDAGREVPDSTVIVRLSRRPSVFDNAYNWDAPCELK